MQEQNTQSGLALLQALVKTGGHGSPIGETMGMTATAVEEGRITIEARPDKRHLNPAGLVHGGFAATCLDGATGLALFSTLDASTGYATVDLNVKYLRPLAVGSVYEVRGWVVERTRTLAVCDGDIRGADGKLYAKTTATLMVRG
jgi:uncharacterized protein (TIGR00369 family)